MPYLVQKNDDQWCVYRQDDGGGATGSALGCHDEEDDAKQQMAALYANEPEASKAIKFVADSDDVIEGIGMPFGGPFNGRDLQGEFFSAKTDFAFDWFEERPLLYEHGFDGAFSPAVVGRVKSWRTDPDVGVWFEAQLETAHQYYEAIKELVKKNKLFASSGALSHLIAGNARTGEITRWPWVELSLTTRPANPMAQLDFATAKKHFESAGIDAQKLDTEIAIKSFDTALLIETPIKGHANIVADIAGLLLERTKDLHQRRRDEGRDLSDSNKVAIGESLEALKFLVDGLQAIIVEGDADDEGTKGPSDADRARQLQLAGAFVAIMPS